MSVDQTLLLDEVDSIIKNGEGIRRLIIDIDIFNF